MMNLPETIVLSIKTDEYCAIRVSGTQVTLDVLIVRHKQGDSPEDIHARFPTVPLTDIYTVISYYLANQAELDAYLAQRDADKYLDEVQPTLVEKFIIDNYHDNGTAVPLKGMSQEQREALFVDTDRTNDD